MDLLLEELVSINASLNEYRHVILIAAMVVCASIACLAYVFYRHQKRSAARTRKLGQAIHRALEKAIASSAPAPDQSEDTAPPDDATTLDAPEATELVKPNDRPGELDTSEQSRAETLIQELLIPAARHYATSLSKLRARIEARASDEDGSLQDLALKVPGQDFWTNAPDIGQSDCAIFFADFESLRREITILSAALEAAREMRLDDRQLQALFETVVAIDDQASRLKTSLSLFEKEEPAGKNVLHFREPAE